MTTPFEFFRTPIQIRRYTQGFYQDGIWISGTYFFIQSDLVSGNVISVVINGTTYTRTYAISSLATMTALAQLIKAAPGVTDVLVRSQGRLIEVIPTLPAVFTVTSVTVTGGASQPTTGFINQPTVIEATASVQPLGKDVELVPEGRRDSAEFKFYTSTEIFGVTTQNPDQVTVLKAPFTGIVYEVINISDWQNNANFNIVNHYKFAALRLHPLPGVLG